MKKLIVITLALLLSLSLVSSLEKDYYGYKSLDLKIKVFGETRLSNPANLKVSLNLIPQTDSFQVIKSINEISEPKAGVSKGDEWIYSWDSVSQVTFGYDSEVSTSIDLVQIKEIPFPVQIEENQNFKKSSDHIDSDNLDISKKANELASGKTDLFSVVFALADFVNSNLTYDKNYIDSNVKASKVLELRRGVCDEYSNLLIALCRSLGIPAKYVSGMAFSNLKNDFGPHAWAEIYFPGYGWIPFDPTYGQYGILDATHIALSKTVDSESSVSYAYNSKEIYAEDLVINASVENTIEVFSPKAQISVRPLKNEVREGSYVPIEVKIKNLQDFYLPLNLHLSKSPEIIGRIERPVLLKPNQEKKIYYLIQLPSDNINKGYIYTAAIEAKAMFNEVATAEITFGKLDRYENVSLESAQKILASLSEDENTFNYTADLECKSPIRYSGEIIKINCSVSNKGTMVLDELILCFESDCRNFSLSINEVKSVPFIVNSNKTEFIAYLAGYLFEKKYFISVPITPNPEVEIVSFSPELDYSNSNEVLQLKTKSRCENLKIKIKNYEITADEIEGEQNITLALNGLAFLNENVRISASCYDLNNKTSSDEKVFEIKITNLPWYLEPVRFILTLF